MKLNHKQIYNSLPEYVKNKTNDFDNSEITSHLRECTVCKEELEILSQLHNIKIPYPSEMYWENLSSKIEASIEHKRLPYFKRFWLKPAALIAAAVLLITIAFLSYNAEKRLNLSSLSLLIDEPIDYNTLDYDDLESVLISEDIDSDALNVLYFDIYAAPYMELAALGQDELENLFEELNINEQIGG
ncbi:hypothetical protein MCHI_000401 [Candidatus Magnetoovum chiemensis]|nr:hypothetical protein MCHI_000401 [Candidatus Magnetoovum chiemensis]